MKGQSVFTKSVDQSKQRKEIKRQKKEVMMMKLVVRVEFL